MFVFHGVKLFSAAMGNHPADTELKGAGFVNPPGEPNQAATEPSAVFIQRISLVPPGTKAGVPTIRQTGSAGPAYHSPAAENPFISQTYTSPVF